MNELNDLYSVLNVSSGAPHEVIRAAYRVMAKLHHPDTTKGGADDSSRMALINKAYEVLSCPLRRLEYDQAQREFASKRLHNCRNTHRSFDYPTTVLMTYDHRGRLHTYA